LDSFWLKILKHWWRSLLKHTIILTSYNRPTWITEAIESVKAQSFQDFECLIADDNSNKKTLAAIQSAVGKDSRFKLLQAQNVGPHRMVDCINGAVSQAKGQVIHYLPDDDKLARARLEIADEFFRKHPTSNACYGFMLPIVQALTVDAEKHLAATASAVSKRLNVNQIYHCKQLTAQIDHGQVMHRAARGKTALWDRNSPVPSPDGSFYTALNHATPIYPLGEFVIAKRYHELGVNLRKQYMRDCSVEWES
jgi:glycosyltransferase involved in cell wall biosynthesis